MSYEYFVWTFIIAIYCLLFVIYFGYPLTINWFPKSEPKSRNTFDSNTWVYHIIPMYNEGAVAERKIRNTLKIDYRYKWVSVFVLDQSEDDTGEILRTYANKFPDKIVFIDKGYRRGKNDSINAAMELLKPKDTDILFFSDANTFFESDAFSFLLDDLQKGCGLVGGSMQYYDETSGTAISEGLYWKYEEWIRKNEAKLGKCVVVNGGNFAMLAKHYSELPSFVPNDLEAPLRLCGTGVYVGFNERSKGYESAVVNDQEEWDRKKRMGNRQMNCITYLWNYLDFGTKMHIISRKILRWSGFHILVFNFCLSIMLGFISNMAFKITFTIGIIGIIGIGLILGLYGMGTRIKLIVVAIHAIKVHTYSFAGMFSSLLGARVSTWNKSKSNRSR